VRSDWGSASLSDLILLRKAIKENWPVPSERRRPLLEAVFSNLNSENARLVISACQVALTAEEHNQKLDELERAEKSS